MSLVDCRPLCERCGVRHFCLSCSGAKAEQTVADDATHAARLEIVEWLERRAVASRGNRRGVHASWLESLANVLRKEYGL